MNQKEHWKKIVQQHDEKAIIPFLKQMDDTQKKALLPQLSKTAKEYLEIKDRLINYKHFYAKKASLKQERILNYSIFVCTIGPTDDLHKWLDANKLITPFTVQHILNWYCPNWWNDYVNSFDQQKNIPSNLTYELVLVMMVKGYLQPTELLIAKLLSHYIFPTLPNERLVHRFCPEKLDEYPITLNQHIWYIFDYSTDIYALEKQIKLRDKENLPKNCWYAAIKQYVKTQQIDRFRLLKACLTATSKSIFNKPAISWFIGLFESLAPTEKELLNLQAYLFATYLNPHARVLTTSLKNIRKIIANSHFQIENSLIYYDKLLANPTKSVVINALINLEKIAKYYPAFREKSTVLATHSFVHRVEKIQAKAARIIQLYRQENVESLSTLITTNSPNLFQKTRQTLQNINITPKTQPTHYQHIASNKPTIVRKKSQIPSIQTFNEFKDLALIIFDNQQSYYFDQFLVGLLTFQSAIKGKNIEVLTPVFKRAYQLVFNELPSHQGMLDNILAIFLMDYADLLISQYPTESQSLQKLAKNYLEQGFFIKEKDAPFDLQYAHLYGWYNPYDPSQVYMPIKKLLAKVLSFLHEGKSLPLLSTPTHIPIWISPEKLIERLAIYQAKQEQPDAIDLQLAISRIRFENKAAALKLAQTTLSGDYLTLITFLFSENNSFNGQVFENAQRLGTEGDNSTLPPLFYSFITAAITKNSSGIFTKKHQLPALKITSAYFTGQHDWMVFWEERRLEEWNYKTQKLEFTGAPFIHRELQVKFKKGLNIKHHPDFLYQYFPGNDEAFRPNINDVQQLLGMLPNNPDPIIILLLADNLKYPSFWEAIARKRVVEILTWLTQYFPKKHGYATHFFLATCMLSANKKIRLSAGEIWKNAIVNNQINSVLIGQILGKMECKEYAPLQRFTDLAQTHLFNISKPHNQALEEVISHLLAKLPAVPIRNTKKLLVLYRELLAINATKITNERLLILLSLWTKSASLKKVIRELTAFC